MGELPLAFTPCLANDWPIQTKISLCFLMRQSRDGQSYRLLNIIDDYKREGLAMEVGLSLPASPVIRTLNQLLKYRTTPQAIRCDNGPEFTSHEFQSWATQKASELNTSNLASHSKMLILNAITAPSGMAC